MSTGYYKLKGAILNEVKRLYLPIMWTSNKEYKTLYLGGTLELTNANGTPWFDDDDPSPYIIALKTRR